MRRREFLTGAAALVAASEAKAFGIGKLGSGLSTFGALGRASSGPLPTFAFQAETTALVSAWATAGTTMSRRRQCTFDRGIRRLKNFPAGDPVWPCLKGLWKAGPTLATTMINVVTPGTFNLTQVGSITLAANATVSTSTGYFRTGINCNTLPVDDYAFGCFSSTAAPAADTSTEMGARDATNGLTMGIWSSAASKMAARCGGAVSTAIGNTTDWDGQYFNAVTRSGSASFDAYRNGRLAATIANASAALPAQEMYFLGSNNNGTPVSSTKSLSSGFIALRHLTAAQMKELAAVMTMWHNWMAEGAELDQYEAGYQPQSVSSYDAVVYGATAAGVLAARELIRQGRTVCIVGGWRDYNVSGTPGVGGLGYTDTTNSAAITGLAKYLINRTNTINSTANVYFEPRTFDRACRELLDPAFSQGADIPIYWSTGAVSAVVSGGQIKSFKTRDGRTFSAKVFIDCSYEMDLAYVSGCTMIVGREAAGTGTEAANGFRGVQSNFGTVPNPAVNHAGSSVNIDPWVTPGDTNSGLIAGVQSVFTNGTPANGSADSKVQSMAYRLTLTTTPAYLIPFPSTPPSGYATSKYEMLLRLLATDPTLTIADIFNIQTIATGVFDFNTKNLMSSDYIDPTSTEYATASYARREQIIALNKSYILGLWYLLQYDADSRVPAALRTVALTYGFSAKNHFSPNYGDDQYFNHQIYVRSGRRIVGDPIAGTPPRIFDANDLMMTDGTTPRSINTVAQAAYDMDSHAIEYRAYFGADLAWKVIFEGNIYITPTSGTDKKAPIPYEYMLPKTGDPSNLLCLFGGSATNVAISEIRMEPPFWNLGQSAGMAAALAVEAGDYNVQNLASNYSTLRTRLLGITPLLTNETTLVLPQVN